MTKKTFDESSESNQTNINDNYSKSNQQTIISIWLQNTHFITLSKKKFIIGLKGLNGLPFNTNNHSLAIRKVLNPTIKIPLMSVANQTIRSIR